MPNALAPLIRPACTEDQEEPSFVLRDHQSRAQSKAQPTAMPMSEGPVASTLHSTSQEFPMAEVISVVVHPIVINGRTCRVQVCGRLVGLIWEGWIEFEASKGDVFRTARETTQPNRDALEYWAGGLSTTYLEGALTRALNPSVEAPPAVVVGAPHFSAPAPAVVRPEPVVLRSAVLDPYSVGAKGEVLLRQELGALRGWHLRNIIVAYNVADPTLDLESLSEPELIELIVAAVEPSVSA